MSSEPILTLTLSEEGARWRLATAATVLRRILEGLPAAANNNQTYVAAGQAALHRLAERLPVGYYPPRRGDEPEEVHCLTGEIV
jgi:hypothetical protein